MAKNITDILIIGGGIIGLSTARHLALKGIQVSLIEKDFCGAHTSGRNSGVVHAGIYYDKGSAKAIYSVRGNQMLSDYCRNRGVPFQNIGKIIAPMSNDESDGIEALYQRAKANGAPVQLIDYQEAKEIEPRIRQRPSYIWSPSTSIASNSGVIKALKSDCEDLGVQIFEKTKYLSKVPNTSNQIQTQVILSSQGKFEFRHLFNCAGLFSDQIANDYGLAQQYEILPMLGFYLYGHKQVEGFKTLVYPLPRLQNEALGVHTTNTTDGRFKLGPTAFPGFWREQYGWTENFSFQEFSQCVVRYMKCLNSPYRKFYLTVLKRELPKLFKKSIVDDCDALVTGLKLEDYQEFGPIGVFPQLVNKETCQPIVDFKVEMGENSTHFVNVVSPGWTSALAFTETYTKSFNF